MSSNFNFVWIESSFYLNFPLFLCLCSFLRVVDRFNSLLVSAFITPGGSLMLMLHNGKSEEVVRTFFTEVNDIYAKYIMNPFSDPDAPIVSPQFDLLVRSLAKRLL